MSEEKRQPYPGLRAFTSEESDLFFGREGCVDAMVDLLGTTRFLAVLGPSGGGKSSLVRTGLLDALEMGLLSTASSRWSIADLHPGGQPMRKLAAALLKVKAGPPADERDVDLMASFLRRGPRSVLDWAGGGNIPPDCNLLILVDQFEELFRYADYAQREEAEAFVAMLLESSLNRMVPIYIVITMRSEYLGACASIGGLAERISAGLYLTPRMDREECREAIVGPAGVLGLKVEPALVNRMLNDLASFSPWEASDAGDLAAQLARQADQLPLMQHVLNRLWLRAEQDSDGGPVELKLAEYDELGGLSGALDAHGAEVVAELGPGRLGAIESVFRALVSGDSLATAVRRPCRMGELVAAANGARSDVVAIVEAFRAPDCNFLRSSDLSLASDDVIVDISHESLIRQWTPLREWLEKEVRDGAAWRRLAAAAERYVKREGGLLTGLDLQNLAAWWEAARPVQAWVKRYGGELEPVNAFLQTSRQADEALVEAEHVRQVRGRKRLIAGVAVLAFLLAIVSTLGYFARRDSKLANRESAKSAKALDQLTSITKNLEHVNRELQITKGVSDANAARLSAALKEETVQKNRADTERASAENDARRLTNALDDVRGVITSDKYGHLIGVGNLQADLMQSIQKYRSDIEKQHESMVGGANKVRDDYLSALAMGAIGEAEKERQLLKKGYEDGLKEINSTPSGKFPSVELQTDFLDDGYIYVWFLLDIGESKEADEVLKGIEGAMSRHFSTPTSSPMLVAFGRIESLRDRISSEQKPDESSALHARKALEFAKRATALRDASPEAFYFEIRVYLNLTLDAKAPEKEAFKKEACKLADQWYSSKPFDERFIRTKVECIESVTIPDKEYDRGKSVYLEARRILDGGLQLDPNNQALLLLRAEAETSLAYYCYKLSQDEEGRQDRLSAKNDFVRALQGRTVFQAKPGQLKNIYTDLTLVDFKDSGDELRYYTDIIDALKETLSAFPKAVSFSYIAADASVHVGELLANSPEKASGAEPYLSESRAWFDRQGLMTKTSTYSEDFTQYCKIYKTRIKMYGAMHRPDLALQDINTVMTTCQAVLDKYPWDIYLRYQIILSNYEAGKALFDAHRFKEALPYLNYASHWGDKQSTQLLAKLYREGLGIDKGDKRALELDALAAGQILTSYTVQADFNGVQQPTKFYIRDWPSEYPYEGIDDQAIWLKEARGATFPPDVIDSFHKLVKIAKDNKVSFRELTEYALKSTDDKAERAKPAPVKRTGPNERARPQYDLALGFGKQEKWPEAAKALEGALVLDPESADILELAVGLYHDKLFLYKRAFELNARLVDLGTGAGDDDFVESHLTTSRFESCTVLSAIDRDKSPEKSRKLVMMALNFACLFGEKKYGAALSAGRKLRADLGGLERVGWNFAGTKHFLGEDKAFAKKSTDWVSLFEALEEGDEKKAQAALTALGAPEAGK